MNLFNRFLGVSLVFAAGILGAQTVSPSLTASMAVLDKAYIPALSLTGQKDIAQAQTAVSKFEAAWETFKIQNKDSLGTDLAWKKDQTALDEVLKKAHNLVFTEKKNAEAHEALEQVREILLSARERMNIPYFADSLTRFHKAMEIYLTESKSEADHLKVLTSLAQEVRNAEPLLPVQGLSPSATQVYTEQWTQMLDLLKQTSDALVKKDASSYKTAKGKIKPLFIKTFFLFGDFPTK